MAYGRSVVHARALAARRGLRCNQGLSAVFNPGSLVADLIPFGDLSTLEVIVVFAVTFAGFFVRGAFGFGSNLPFVLVTTWILGPHRAIVLSVVVAVIAQLHLAPQGVRSADWPVVRPITAGLLIGTVIGTSLFAALSPQWLTVIMAVLILMILIMDRYGVFERIGSVIDLRAGRVALPLATLSGSVGSVSGGGGMYFLIAYLKLACRDALSLRGTNLMLSVFYQVGRLVALALVGYISAIVLVESVALLPAVFAGTLVGTRFFERGSEQRFYRGLQLVLLLAAAALLVKGVLRVLG